MSKFNKRSTKLVPQWQLDKMESILIDRWHETWTVVQQRESARKRSQRNLYPNQISL